MSSLLFGNGTDIVRWQPNCNTRGTFDILSICIITMLLCVWTAVHLNVPPPGSDWESRLRKVGWLILALLAPEMVAYTAWYVCLAWHLIAWLRSRTQTVHSQQHKLTLFRYQRQQALFIMHKVNEIFDLPNPPFWYDTAAKGIIKTVARLKRATMLPSQGPARVSLKSYNCVARVNCTNIFIAANT